MNSPFARIFDPRNLMVASLVASGLVLGGCGERTQAWSQPESPKENKVEWVVFDHFVAFPPGSNGLSERERFRLDGFVREVGVSHGDQVVLRAKTGAESAFARQVHAHLRRKRISAEIIATPELNTRSGQVLVELGRYVVTPPRCPDWTKPSGADYFNTVSSNWNCASSTNLGMMVANPGDLVHGSEKAPYDGSFATFHMKRYRQGKAPVLRAGGTSGSAPKN